MEPSRRSFLANAMIMAAGAVAYRSLNAATAFADTGPDRYGALVPDPDGIMDLPRGFSYKIISRAGAPMSDGLRTPLAHDGMAAFPDPTNPGRCILVCNHELGGASSEEGGPFETDALGDIPPELVYDFDDEGRPLAGGTTTLVYDIATRQPVSERLSLSGTAKNCAGGPTPRGTWLTCEETELMPGQGVGKPHGFVFEVPALPSGAPAAPVPLTDMGRFRHEATVTDPVTGIVYLTEDQGDGLIYRFLPNAPDRLSEGGRLQTLAILGWNSADLRNWYEDRGTVTVGQTLQTRWVDLEDVTAPEGDLRVRGAAAGAAIFARGEGMCFASGAEGPEIYFACTNGGPAYLGQIWCYRPSGWEGKSSEGGSPGTLELVYESKAQTDLDMCDNIVAAPGGYLVICEDGSEDQYLRILDREGRIAPLARNAMLERSEFCGACFSPDGSTMFVNIQKPGLTLAVTGPW